MPYFPGGYFPSGRVVTASGGGTGGNLEDAILALQTALVASVKAAWTIVPGNIHFDPMPTDPENLPTGVTSALPTAWVLVGITAPMNAEQVKRAAGFGQVSVLVPCMVIGRFQLPTSGNVSTVKYGKMQSFLNLVTATSTVYAGYRYWNVSLNLAELPDETNHFYEVGISFDAEVVTDA